MRVLPIAASYTAAALLLLLAIAAVAADREPPDECVDLVQVFQEDLAGNQVPDGYEAVNQCSAPVTVAVCIPQDLELDFDAPRCGDNPSFLDPYYVSRIHDVPPGRPTWIGSWMRDSDLHYAVCYSTERMLTNDEGGYSCFTEEERE